MDNVFYIINDNKVELSNGKEYSLVDFIDILVNYINQLETNRDEAIEYLKYALDEEKETPSKHNDWRLDLLEILERGKEWKNQSQ